MPVDEELTREACEPHPGIAASLVPIAKTRPASRHCGFVTHSETSYGAGVLSPQPLLTIDNLARLLAVDRKTVYRLPIPYVVVGTRRRFRAEDVDAYLKRSREPAPLTGAPWGAPERRSARIVAPRLAESSDIRRRA